MLNRLIILGLLLFAAGVARAQSGWDYYSVESDHQLQQHLKMAAGHWRGCVELPKLHQYLGAYSDCTFILRYFPNHPEALFQLGRVCEAWKDPRCDPEEWFEKAIAINPSAATTYVVIGINRLRLKKISEAIASLKQGVDLEPGSINAHYNLALAYFDAKEFELSNQHAQLAYQLGAPLPGLRDKLKRAGQWKPDSPPVAGAPESSTSQH